MKRFAFFALIPLLALSSCRNGQQGRSTSDTSDSAFFSTPAADAPAEGSLHSFPEMSLPMVYGDDPTAAREYALQHYWDRFFSVGGPTTADAVLGVADGEVEQALANYIGILQAIKSLSTPDDLTQMRQAQKSVGTLFSKIEGAQLADTSSLVFLRMTEMVSKYLYDPNSPVRDEDFYLPFAEAAARSRVTPANMVRAFEHEAAMCRVNQYGDTVPDFKFSDIKGRKGSLYGINAAYTMLFFSNPGCNSCKEIISEVLSRNYISSYIADGRLAIVNIYIDEEVSKWRDYVPNYPTDWINGYDYTFQLRDSGKYDIRAIPSLYLLDSSKRVLLKDAPTERVLSYLDQI